MKSPKISPISRQAILVSHEYIENISRIAEELMKEAQLNKVGMHIKVYEKIHYLSVYINALEESANLLKHHNMDTYVGEAKRGKYTERKTKGQETKTI